MKERSIQAINKSSNEAWGTVSNLLRGRGTAWEEARTSPPSPHSYNTRRPPSVDLKIKMAAINSKTRSISTIIRKNRGL